MPCTVAGQLHHAHTPAAALLCCTAAPSSTRGAASQHGCPPPTVSTTRGRPPGAGHRHCWPDAGGSGRHAVERHPSAKLPVGHLSSEGHARLPGPPLHPALPNPPALIHSALQHILPCTPLRIDVCTPCQSVQESRCATTAHTARQPRQLGRCCHIQFRPPPGSAVALSHVRGSACVCNQVAGQYDIRCRLLSIDRQVRRGRAVKWSSSK